MRFFLSCACGMACAAASIFSADWPQWRGPARDGHAPPNGKLIPALPAEPKTIWKIKAGPGLASPVVAGAVVIHFDAVGPIETIHALDRETGKELWRAEIDQTFHDMQGPDGPRCTPVIDGDRVYAVSCRGELKCLNLAGGREIWSANFARDFGAVFIGEKGSAPGASRHGNNGTPLVAGDFLYACVGGSGGAGVVCFDKRNGKVIWKSQDDPAAYAPPMIASLAGRDQLLCFTAEGLIGLNPADGALFWRVPVKTAFARHVTAPLWHSNIVVVSSHQAGLIGTRIVAGGTPAAEQAWVSRESAINFSSPVAVQGNLYGLGQRKNLICVEIASGKQLWSKEGYFQTSADKAYAGFLVIGKNILMLTDGGLLVLFEASPERFREIGTAQVCGANWCNPAYADGRMILRDGNQGPGSLLCLDLLE